MSSESTKLAALLFIFVREDNHAASVQLTSAKQRRTTEGQTMDATRINTETTQIHLVLPLPPLPPFICSRKPEWERGWDDLPLKWQGFAAAAWKLELRRILLGRDEANRAFISLTFKEEEVTPERTAEVLSLLGDAVGEPVVIKGETLVIEELPANAVDIAGLPKHVVLAALCRAATPPPIDPGLPDNLQEFELLLKAGQVTPYTGRPSMVDYVCGRAIKTDIGSDSIDPTEFDRNNGGSGTAAAAIATVRPSVGPGLLLADYGNQSDG